MKFRNFVGRFGLCGSWVLTVAGGAAINAETAEKQWPTALLAELKTRVGGVKPFVAEHTLTGPSREPHAEIGVGRNNLFYQKAASENPTKQCNLLARWTEKDWRLFTRSNSTTLLKPELGSLADSASELRPSLFGNSNKKFVIYLSFCLKSASPNLSISTAGDWIDILKDDPTLKISDERLPRLEISKREVGQLLVELQPPPLLNRKSTVDT